MHNFRPESLKAKTPVMFQNDLPKTVGVPLKVSTPYRGFIQASLSKIQGLFKDF